ncbi:uncharacterized protein [Choristoneura fumiferana]
MSLALAHQAYSHSRRITKQFHNLPAPNKKVTDKKYDDEHEGNFNLSAFDRNAKEKEMKAVDTNIKPLALVWDSYMQDADHDSRFQKNRQIGSIWSEGLSKRDAADTNNSIAIKSWLSKYNNLRASNTVNGPVQKSDSLLIRKIAKPSTTMIPSTTIQMIPITRDIFNNPTESFNMSVDVVVTENNIRASYTEDWFEAKDRSKIRFGGPPQTETYLIPTLKPEEGFHPFGFMSHFFALIYPFEFPVGLAKDVVWGKFSFPYSFLQVQVFTLK